MKNTDSKPSALMIRFMGPYTGCSMMPIIPTSTTTVMKCGA